tara:strand:+ start:320 stop:463 length:144 start_codon:yes stop_codon:yes gene_type:complete
MKFLLYVYETTASEASANPLIDGRNQGKVVCKPAIKGTVKNGEKYII